MERGRTHFTVLSWRSSAHRTTKASLHGTATCGLAVIKTHRIAIATFEIDDSVLTENGFTCCDAYPKKFIGNTLALTSTDPLCVKVYSDSLTDYRFVVGSGQSFGKDWIYVVSDESNIILGLWDYAFHEYYEMKVGTLDHAKTHG